MLDLPGVVDAQLVGELDLVKRVLEQLQLTPVIPRPRQLVLASAKSGFCAAACIALGFVPVRRNRYALRAIMHAGVVSGLLGVREIQQYGAVEATS